MSGRENVSASSSREELQEPLNAGRSVAFGVVVGLLASGVLLAFGRVLYGWNPGGTETYRLSEGLSRLVGLESVAAAAVVLLVLVRSGRLAYLASLLAFSLPYVVVIFLEIRRAPSSHNLFPFELAFLAVLSVIAHVPAVLLKLWPRAVNRRPGTTPRSQDS